MSRGEPSVSVNGRCAGTVHRLAAPWRPRGACRIVFAVSHAQHVHRESQGAWVQSPIGGLGLGQRGVLVGGLDCRPNGGKPLGVGGRLDGDAVEHGTRSGLSGYPSRLRVGFGRGG